MLLLNIKLSYFNTFLVLFFQDEVPNFFFLTLFSRKSWFPFLVLFSAISSFWCVISIFSTYYVFLPGSPWNYSLSRDFGNGSFQWVRKGRKTLVHGPEGCSTHFGISYFICNSPKWTFKNLRVGEGNLSQPVTDSFPIHNSLPFDFSQEAWPGAFSLLWRGPQSSTAAGGVGAL